MTIRLYTCEADLEKALSSLESYRRDLKDRDSRIHQLTSELHAHISDKEHLQEVLGANKERQEHLSHEYDRQIGSLQVSMVEPFTLVLTLFFRTLLAV